MPTDPTLSTFVDVRAMLLALVQSIAPTAPNGTGYQVDWENARRDFTDSDNQARILLKTRGLQGIGFDEDRITYDSTQPAGQELTTTKCGNRKFFLTIKVESSDFEVHTADAILSYMYTRMQWDSSAAQLNAANCAYYGDHPMVSADFPRDGNWVSCALIEFELGWAVNDTDTANPGGYITEAVIDGAILNPDGTPRPVHIDVTTP